MIVRLIFLACLVLLTSCSRTVTDRSTTLFLEVRIAFRSTIDTEAYNYVLVLSDDTSTTIASPEPYPDSNYLILPGLSYDENELDELDLNVSDFYDDYFDTWQDMISIHENDLELVRSDDDFFDASTSINNTYEPEQTFLYTSNFEANPSVLILTFDLEQLGDLSGTKQFTIMVLDASSGDDAGILLETLEEDVENTFEIQAGEDSFLQEEPENSAISGSADITAWRIRVF